MHVTRLGDKTINCCSNNYTNTFTKLFFNCGIKSCVQLDLSNDAKRGDVSSSNKISNVLILEKSQNIQNTQYYRYSHYTSEFCTKNIAHTFRL